MRGEGWNEKSSAAYVGFRARLAATVAATATAAAALIRVRRYEIIKLGLDGGEGDGMAREYDRRVGRRGCREHWMLEAMGRWMAWRRGQGEEDRGITVFRIPVYERQPRRPRFETRAATTAVVAAEEARSER